MPLIHFIIPSPYRPAKDIINSEIQREQQFDTVSLTTFVENNEQLLIDEQKNVYHQINLSIAAGRGIVATLLDGGRTAHSALKLSLNIHTNPDAVCNIKNNSRMAKVFQKCKIYADEINACIKQSYLWRNVSTLRLNINIRVQLQNDPLALSFSEKLLNIGNETIPLHGDTQCIKLLDNLCNMVNTKNALIESIFPNLQANYINHAWLPERAILAAKNIDVDAINFKIQQSLPGNEKLFKSIDPVIDLDEAVNYPVEFLNSLDLPGMPPHDLRLKIGSPIIMLRI
ncbi:hypothetical protein EVAR_46955_1 [Eumeta japonica]|uniref:ATP-dependent DNA helicase n=1 Tax=Eumeta variegata TaxID=151549 RepID=A0A4C1YNW8_EUMVA|nr:hypothetical protein EVAR_46955_1 [Eumeta japonica]